MIPGLGRSPLEEEIVTPVFLPGKSHGQRSLVGYSPWGLKDSDMKEESEKAGLKLNIQNMKIMASGLNTSWQTDEETLATVKDCIFLGSKVTVDGD